MNQSVLIVGSTVAVVLALLGAWVWVSSPDAGGREPLVDVEGAAEAAEFAEILRTGILTSQNFVGHRIRVVEGALRNVGDRPLRSVRLRLSFEGVEGGPVLESDEEALIRPLEPGAERRFEFRYENLPETWNYRVPVVSVTGVSY